MKQMVPRKKRDKNSTDTSEKAGVGDRTKYHDTKHALEDF